MDLWIRTQSKTSIMKVDNIKCIGNKIVTNIDTVNITLGTYGSEAEALEIIDEIQLQLEETYSLGDKFGPIVYEMPEK